MFRILVTSGDWEGVVICGVGGIHGASAVFADAGILKLGVGYVRFIVLCVILFLYT